MPDIVPEEVVDEVGAAIARVLLAHHSKIDQRLAGDLIRAVINSLEAVEGRKICPPIPGAVPSQIRE